MPRWIFPLLLLFSSVSYAEPRWVTLEPTFQVRAHHIFLQRKAFGPELTIRLGDIRNVTFNSREALAYALAERMTPEAYVTFAPKLIEQARGQAMEIGYEFIRDDIVVLKTRKPNSNSTEPGFLADSWIPKLAHQLPETVQLEEVDSSQQSKRIKVTLNGQCLDVYDRVLTIELTQFCVNDQQKSELSATLDFSDVDNVYGLGQEFQTVGDTRVNRLGHRRNGRNAMPGFNKGANGNTLFPVAYALSAEKQFALFLDNRYPQTWDLTEHPSPIKVSQGDFELILMAGNSLKDLRQKYMLFSGFPKVPPKAAFGLWLSEYGFNDWQELDDKVDDLLAKDLPLSGVVMDLQWFGDILGPDGSQMGSLTWDRTRFPEPEKKIAELKTRGIDMMLIEESYVSHTLDTFEQMSAQQFLAHDGAGKTVTVGPSWWGEGGMVDWINPEAGDWWHSTLRQPLIDMGILGHWTDLGEPEIVHPDFHYGLQTPVGNEAIYNSYNLKWIESIYAGYQTSNNHQRPFIMSRSGGVGMQALAAAMWSGDIGSDFGSLAAQMPQQSHMMWSGMDYYGSDVGGFHRQALQVSGGDRTRTHNDLYTQWLAYASLFEVPVRPHTSNLCNCKETSPALIGDLESNRANLNLRYEMIPYYYSLAHRAHQTGEPVFPALSYDFQSDAETWSIGHVKQIGPFLIAGATAEANANTIDMYFPTGRWFNYRTGAMLVSEGEWHSLPTQVNSRYELPLFAQTGALIPTIRYSETESQHVLKVFGFGQSEFTWQDDDGTSIEYLARGPEQLQLRLNDNQLTLARRRGSELVIDNVEWWLPKNQTVDRVLWNDVALPKSEWQQTDEQLKIDLPNFEQEGRLSVH